MKTLYLYLLKELFPAFVLGLVGFTGVLLIGRILQLTDLFVNKGFPLINILAFLYYLLPSFLVLTIPMATLLAVLLIFNRLTTDNEITAMKASGLSLYQLTPPVLGLSVLAFVLTVLLSLYVLPRANYASRTLLYEMASTRASAGVKERVFNDEFEGLVLYVERVVPKTLHWENVFISDSRSIAETYSIIAREGKVLSDPSSLTVTLRLRNGAIHKLGKEAEAYQKIDFNTYDLRLDLKTGMKTKQSDQKHPADMSLRELGNAVQALRSKKADARPQMVKIHEKFSIPFACLVFGIIAVPLGAQAHSRSGKSMGLASSIGVLLVYYLLTNAGSSLAERGIILLEAGMWGANAVFLALGIYLLVKAARESPVLVILWLEKGFARLKNLLRRKREGGR